MTLTTLLLEWRYLLDELTESGSHWTDLRGTAWINEGQGDIAVRLPPALLPKLGTSWTKHLSNGVDAYTFDEEYVQISAIGLNYESSVSKMGDYRQARLIPISDWNKLDDSVFWEGTKTWPNAAIHGQTVYIDPIATGASTDGMKIWYIRPPVDMDSGTDEPEVPQFTHRWLVQFAVYKALLEDGDARANDQLGKYLENFKRFGGG